MPIPSGSIGGLTGGVGGGGYSLDASAKSSAAAHTGAIRQQVGPGTVTSGSGARALQNFVAFSGGAVNATSSDSTGINPFSNKIPFTNVLVIIGTLALVALIAIRFIKH